MLGFHIVTLRGSHMIRIEFEKKIKWIGLTLPEAVELQRLLGRHIDGLLAMNLSMEEANGRGD